MKKIEKSQPFSTLINGLRGLAVLLVLGFHFNVPFLEQGFWGVDLFFWISGFLITGGFLREYEKNREVNQKFGWIDVRYYFIRRVKRILPLSLLVTFLVSVFVILSGNAEAISQTFRRLPRILTFTLNMQLQNDAQDYFLGSSQDYGLLHYWSLAVEEQIYILSPFIFLLAVSFHGRKIFGWRSSWINRVLILNIALSIASFIFMLFQNKSDSVANYYSTFSRFWEFGLGTICAIFHYQGISRKITYQLSLFISHLSSFTLIASLVFLKNDIFGPIVLIPLLSASMFVLINFSTRRKTLLTKILETSGLQFLGRIAFPLYLVHWPAMVLLHNSKYHSSLLNVLLYIVFVLAISYILHRYVELPTMRINLERFKIKADSDKVRDLSGRARSRKKSLTVILVFTISPIIWLSYPTEASRQFDSISSFFLGNRYGTLTDNSSKAEPEISAEPSQESPSTAQGLLNKNTKSPAPVISALESLTTKTRKEKAPERLISTWMNELLISSQVIEVPKGYKVDQSQVVKELRRGWNSGCLDSKSFESACSYGTGSKTAVLLGDSFSFALLGSIKESLPRNWKLIVLTKGSCLPWAITQFISSGELNKECNDHNEWVNERIKIEKPDLIIATGADQWLQKSTFEKWSSGFSTSLKFYNDNSTKVVIVSSAPGSGNLNNCVSNEISLRFCFGSANQISKFVNFQSVENKKYNSVYINLIDYLCVNGSCPPILQNVPVYADGNHLSNNFSSKFAVVIKSLYLFS